MDKELLEYFNGDELAASVWLQKYAQEEEKTPDDMHKRLAKEFYKIEKKYNTNESETVNNITWNKLSFYGRHREHLTEKSIYNLFKDFKYIVPQGSIMSQLGSESIGSLSNCFVIGQPQDSYGGIMQKDEEMAQLMKRRGGVGIDISTLRPSGTATSNAAKSSTGAVSFMHRFSNTTREVAQNGRRGALMISMDINHPDILEFVKIKRDLSQVTGANISIKLNDEFMKAVENDEDYILRFPCNIETNKLNPKWRDGLYKLVSGQDVHIKRIRAKELWNEIIKSAHNVAEPGLMFWNNMVDYSPDGVYDQYRPITTNPCSEIGMQEYDACRLIAVNLYSFVKNPFTKDSYFDFEEFYKVNYEAMRLSDDLIDLELEYIQRIIEKIKSDPEDLVIKKRELDLWENIYKTAKSSRRTGLGFTGLGDTLAALGLGYDSDEGIQMIENIMQSKMSSELDCTIDLSILRGSFADFDDNKEFVNDSLDSKLYGNSFYQFLWYDYRHQSGRMQKYGRRNVSWSTVAPTGTVSLMTQTTSGIEPLFQPFYMRRKKVNPNDKDVRVDFTDQNGDTWQEYPVLHPKFKDWMIGYIGLHGGYSISDYTKEEIQKLFEKSPWYKSTANDIDWIKRVEIQGIIQKYITHSISSTINLPEDVSEEEVSKIYMKSWKKGLKGITVYRDGSRSGVLVANNEKKDNNKFMQNNAPKRPRSLKCDIHHLTAKGEKWTVLVGLFEDKPYEVFCVKGTIASNYSQGVLEKHSSGKYALDVYKIDGSEGTSYINVAGEMTDEQASLTRMISTALRHGADIKFIVEQLNKADGIITSFSKAIARTLKKYIPTGEKSGVTCNNCGSKSVIFEEGCHKCKDCGNSACS